MPELTCSQLLADIRERARNVLLTIEHDDRPGRVEAHAWMMYGLIQDLARMEEVEK